MQTSQKPATAGWWNIKIVIQATLRTHATIDDALENDLVRHLDLNHRVDVITLQKEVCLVRVAREAVENEAVIPVVRIQATLDHFLDDVVGHHFAARNQSADAGRQFGMALDVPAKNVADADVHQIEVLGQHLRLRPFAAALNAHDDVFPHGWFSCGKKI